MRPALCIATLLAAFALASCDMAAPGPEPDGLRVSEVVVTTPDGRVVAHSHDDHWHGTLRATVGVETPLRAWVVSADMPDVGHDVPLREFWIDLTEHPEYRLRITTDDESVARWSGDRHALTLTSERAGAALTTFVVLRGTTTIYQSPPGPTIAAAP